MDQLHTPRAKGDRKDIVEATPHNHTDVNSRVAEDKGNILEQVTFVLEVQFFFVSARERFDPDRFTEDNDRN